ncbi:MAG: hypothetical protein F4X72_05545 [Dehalococcoidia bacterium]|nr:hypothetical protein [Dehalococcoidia bacterium]
MTPYHTPSGHEPPPLPHGGLGHIADSTFSVFGAHYLPFILIALLPQIPLLVGGIISLTGIGPIFTFDFPVEPSEEPVEPLQISLWEVLGVILSFVISILAGGATIYAVARHFLGSPVLVRRSYEYAWARFPKLLGSFLLVLLILIVPGVLSVFIIGIPLLVFAVVALLFVTHAVAIEQQGPTDALKRSWNVVQGNWWRTFGLLAGITLAIIGATLIIFLPAGRFLPPALVVLLSTAFSTVVTPIATIAITVLYFDIRVRKEQYTHNDLARELGD